MKQEWKDAATALIMGLVVPYLLLNMAALWKDRMDFDTVETDPTEISVQEPEHQIMIRVKFGENVETLELETYLVGVVLGEMPAEFDEEALKAQAVVARTYTLRRREMGTKHADADICTDPSCCQAYLDPASYGGTQAELNKVQASVESTMGLVLTYEGALIEATYFASSGGRTEDAVAVWGSALPYLQATDSPEYDYADKYLATATFTSEEFQEALGETLEGSCGGWFGHVTYTNGGGVDNMIIGGREYQGTELRRLLGLRSTAFTVSVSGDTITITTRGHGHRVGMSQYGAEAMAVDGSTYEEILTHYYQGAVIEEYIDNGVDMG